VWFARPGALILDGDTCMMNRRAVLLEVPWLPWQPLQLVLRRINNFMVNYKVLLHCLKCYSQSSISVRFMRHTRARFLRQCSATDRQTNRQTDTASQLILRYACASRDKNYAHAHTSQTMSHQRVCVCCGL